MPFAWIRFMPDPIAAHYDLLDMQLWAQYFDF